jgi:hypothetical protein
VISFDICTQQYLPRLVVVAHNMTACWLSAGLYSMLCVHDDNQPRRLDYSMVLCHGVGNHGRDFFSIVEKKLDAVVVHACPTNQLLRLVFTANDSANEKDDLQSITM